MKKITIALCMILSAGLLLPFAAKAADTNVATSTVSLTIDGSALLAIQTGSTLTMSLGGASQAGAAVQDVAADTTARLRISSLVSGATTRTITAILGSDMTPSHTELLVQLLTPNGNFTNAANMGTLTSPGTVLSSASAIQLATGIKTCWSGTTTDDGYPIVYTFRRKAGETSFTTPGDIVITYTLSATN